MRKCPWRFKTFKSCFYCQEHGQQLPRLDCDFFEHYLKVRHFRIRKLSRSDARFSGTFILRTDYGVFKGKYHDLVKLRDKLGGKIERYSHFN